MAQSSKARYGAHYMALAAEAARVGWPRSFVNDLFVHDYAFLRGRAVSDSFAWVLRPDGTHLIPTEHEDKRGRWPAPKIPALVAEAFGAESCRFYFWNGDRLESLPDAAACAERIERAREEEGHT